MLIDDLPAETLDQIAAALDSPTDLKNFAAAGRRFRAVVEPYHTQFRVIRAPLLSPLWKKFIENSSLAQNVRVLEIQSAEPYNSYTVDEPVIPAIFSDMVASPESEVDNSDDEDISALKARALKKNARDRDAERILVKALREMSGLTSFQWSRTPPLIDPNDDNGDIWTTLSKHCPSLSCIDVIDREKPYDPALEETDDPAYRRPTLNSNFYTFRNLKKFSLKTEAFNVGRPDIPNVELAAGMLKKWCPDLEVLKLHYILYPNPHIRMASAAPLLSDSSWTSLREVILFGFEITSGQLAAFLSSHPSIEELSLTQFSISEPFVVPSGVLPRLRRLAVDVDSTIVRSILNSVTQTPRPLEDVLTFVLDEAFLDSLERSGSGPTLKKLVTFRVEKPELLIQILSHIANNLQSLRFQVSWTPSIDYKLYSLISQFSHLRALHGIKFLNSDCDPPGANAEVVKCLSRVCPELTRLDWYMGGFLDTSLVAVIKRNGNLVTWHLHEARRGMEGVIFDGWGERGTGSFLI